MFSPSDHEALLPLVTGVSPFSIVIVAAESVAVAVTLLLALLVVAVYSVTALLKVGVSVNDPIASPDRVVMLLPPRKRQSRFLLPVQPH